MYDKEIAIPEDAMVIAADGGLKHTEKLGITPDIILGDFDSAEKPDCECIVYPSEKDYTDSFIAAKYAFDNGIKTIHMYGVFGGERLDHTVANLAMLEYFAKMGCDITLHGGKQAVQAFFADGERTSIRFDAVNSGYISLFAMGGDIKGLDVKGLKYELSDYTLTTAFPLGVSNEFTGNPSEISFMSGTLMVIYGNCK